MKTCFYCGVELTPPPKLARHQKFIFPETTRTWDHQIPKSRGGHNIAHNRVPCCQGCNVDKGGLTAEEYRVVVAFRNGLVQKPDVLFNAERLESLWPKEKE
jgi:5-methylcytosine-specific restriction endonuclease McrA